MRERPKRAASLLRPCPKCGSGIGIACVGGNGPRLSSHQERHRGTNAKMLARIDAAQARVLAGKAVGFYRTPAWREARYQALKRAGGACQCCGARASLGKPLHVDHIKPRSRFPDLELDVTNLQVLCDDCNLGKGAGDETDWRPEEGGKA